MNPNSYCHDCKHRGMSILIPTPGFICDDKSCTCEHKKVGPLWS